MLMILLISDDMGVFLVHESIVMVSTRISDLGSGGRDVFNSLIASRKAM